MIPTAPPVTEAKSIRLPWQDRVHRIHLRSLHSAFGPYLYDRQTRRRGVRAVLWTAFDSRPYNLECR
jgi:hypothetical protein